MLRARTGGVWKAAKPVSPDLIKIAIDSHDQLWAIYVDSYRDYIAQMDTDGNLSHKQKLDTGETATIFSLVEFQFDPQGYAHIAWSDGNHINYIGQLPDGSFSQYQAIGTGNDLHLGIAGDGTLYLTASTASPHLFRKPVGGVWSAGGAISAATTLPVVAGGPDGRGYVMYGIYYPITIGFQSTTVANVATEGSISQSITIPSNIHKPTLSFAYLLHGVGPMSANHFQAEITDSLSTTALLNTHSGGDWQHAFFDLSAWSGKTVTVTLKLNQAANTPFASVILDDVSVGSWLTPVITQTLFANPKTPIGSQLTIKGQNFIGTPQVKLNSRVLSGVSVVDETTLKAAIPADLPAGRYALYVVNPGGQRVRVDLVIGFEDFLPIVSH